MFPAKRDCAGPPSPDPPGGQRRRRISFPLSDMTSAAAGRAKPKIFLVEDNEDTRVLLAYLLQDAGYEVETAGTMQAALQAFPLSHSKILLSDVGLPDGNGC